MATHHGRPGGRLLEVGLALLLALVSAGSLFAGMAIVFALTSTILGAVHGFSPGAAAALMVGSGGLFLMVARPIMRAVWRGLAAIWKPFLTYYRYEVHSLRQIKEEKATTPGDGRDRIEG